MSNATRLLAEVNKQNYGILRSIIIKEMCERSHLFFSRYFHKITTGSKFLQNWHLTYLCNEIDKIFREEIQYAIFNFPPGSAKTDLVVRNLIARGLAMFPCSRYMTISSSKSLAEKSSFAAQQLISSREFQELWPTQISKHTKSKILWDTVNDNGNILGTVYSAPMGGSITGFRAGNFCEGFGGALIVDDPLQASRITSKTQIAKANEVIINSLQSRTLTPKTPIIIVMQRLHVNDCTGFLEQGGFLKGKWKIVTVPAVVDWNFINKLPENCRKNVNDSVKDENGYFSFWQDRVTLEYLRDLENAKATDANGNYIGKSTFAAQYMQAPIALGGNLIKSQYFKRYDVLPKIKRRTIFADTAQKTGEANDYSVLQLWGYGEDSNIYLLDQIRGKWEAHDLLQKSVAFYKKHELDNGDPTKGLLDYFYIEDKASGTGLIQELKRTLKANIKPIQRSVDKLTRVMDALIFIESGRVYIPNTHWTDGFLTECEQFSADMTHNHDDQIDPMCDAVEKLLIRRGGSLVQALADIQTS